MNGWENYNNRLEKLFIFSNFKIALDFVNQVGNIAENMEHHPDITLQNYNEVLISTITHDTENITDKDIRLAEEIDLLINNKF